MVGVRFQRSAETRERWAVGTSIVLKKLLITNLSPLIETCLIRSARQTKNAQRQNQKIAGNGGSLRFKAPIIQNGSAKRKPAGRINLFRKLTFPLVRSRISVGASI